MGMPTNNDNPPLDVTNWDDRLLGWHDESPLSTQRSGRIPRPPPPNTQPGYHS